MLTNGSCLIWNVRGLNDRARRNVLSTLVQLHCSSLLCLQETKLAVVSVALATECLGQAFDFTVLPAVGTAGGVLLAWLRDT